MTKWFFFSVIFVFFSLSLQAQSDIPDRSVHLPSGRKGTTYEILNLISDLSGYLFMYDSKIINSNRSVRIPAGTYSLKEAIEMATGVKEINAKLFGNHILIYKKTEDAGQGKPEFIPVLSSLSFGYITVEGAVRERESGEPVPNCTVGIADIGTGTVTNQNGRYLLKVPDSLKNAHIFFSHIGYEAQFVPVSLLAESKADVFLDTVGSKNRPPTRGRGESAGVNRAWRVHKGSTRIPGRSGRFRGSGRSVARNC
jgi:hypothetical protein